MCYNFEDAEDTEEIEFDESDAGAPMPDDPEFAAYRKINDQIADAIENHAFNPQHPLYVVDTDFAPEAMILRAVQKLEARVAELEATAAAAKPKRSPRTTKKRSAKKKTVKRQLNRSRSAARARKA